MFLLENTGQYISPYVSPVIAIISIIAGFLLRFYFDNYLKKIENNKKCEIKLNEILALKETIKKQISIIEDCINKYDNNNFNYYKLQIISTLKCSDYEIKDKEIFYKYLKKRKILSSDERKSIITNTNSSILVLQYNYTSIIDDNKEFLNESMKISQELFSTTTQINENSNANFIENKKLNNEDFISDPYHELYIKIKAIQSTLMPFEYEEKYFNPLSNKALELRDSNKAISIYNLCKKGVAIIKLFNIYKDVYISNLRGYVVSYQDILKSIENLDYLINKKD